MGEDVLHFVYGMEREKHLEQCMLLGVNGFTRRDILQAGQAPGSQAKRSPGDGSSSGAAQ